MNDKKGLSSKTYAFLGFSIFDALHIVFAIFFLIHASKSQGEKFEIEMAESLVEIACSILLIVFILALSQQFSTMEEKNRTYSFAWLVASMSLMLPFSFQLPYLLANGFSNDISYIFSLLCLIFSSLSFVDFIVAVFASKNDKKRRLWIYLGIGFFVLLVPLGILDTCFNHLESAEPAWLIVSILRHLAPLFPAVFGYVSLHKEKKEQEIMKETNHE